MSGDVSENEKAVIMDMLRTVRIGLVIMGLVYLGYEAGAGELLGLV